MRSFRISWNHKYLWLIALFSGEGGAGFNFSYSQRQQVGTTKTPNLAAAQEQIGAWLSQHLGLVILLVVVWLVVLIAFFVLAAVCEGATVRAAAEHDAERPFGLGSAWRTGVATMWVMIRFRLLLLALGLPVFILIFGLAAGVVLSIISNQLGTMVVLLVVGAFLVVLAIPYWIYLFFLDRFGTRAVVLEQLAARAAIARAHRLLFKRLGRALLAWILSIGVGLVLGIGLGVVLAILFVPLALIGIGAYSQGSALFWVVLAMGILILLPVALVVQGFVSAQGSTYWTLAFRRLDLEPAPQYYYQQQPAPPQATP